MTLSTGHIVANRVNRSLQKKTNFFERAKNRRPNGNSTVKGNPAIIAETRTEAEKKEVSAAIKTAIRIDHLKGMLAVLIATLVLTALVVFLL